MKKQRKNKKLIIGVTGSFGSGKSTVCAMFKSFGAQVVSADKIAHCLLQPGTAVYKRIVRAFENVTGKEGSIDRKALAKAAFYNKALLERLNHLVHPQVIKGMKKEINACKKRIVVLDVPLLIEAGLDKLADVVIVVRVSRAKQLARVAKKMRISKDQMVRRIKAQMPLKDKVRFADFVIDNNGSFKTTKKEVLQIRRKLWKN